jgi:signal transduction histidine kinase
MSQKTASRLAWSAGIAAILLTIGQTAFMFVDRHVAPPPGIETVANLTWNFANVLNNATNVAAATIGVLLVSRRPENRIGWLFLFASVVIGASGFAAGYGVHALWTEPGSLPAGQLLTWAASWLSFTPLVALTLVFLLFPTGRPRSPRWGLVTKAVSWAWVVAIGASAFLATLDWSHPFEQQQTNTSPFWATVFVLVFAVPIVGSLVAALVAVIDRFRKSTGEERLQLKWFAVGAVFVVLTILATIPWNTPPVIALQDFAFIFLFTAIAIAVLKYRLYEIDVVISKAVVYGTLAVFITLVYVGLVVGVGTLVGNNRSPLLSAVAAAIVAVAFQPVRQWAGRLANRVVYGSRATPYEVLSDFAERIAGTYAAQDVLPRMAEIVAAGTGADRTVVWLRVGDHLQAEASSGGVPETSVLRTDGGLPGMSEGETAVPVSHQGELLGAISVRMPRGETLSESGERLVADVASQAGLVLSNARLIEELRASRQRIVSAQDQARRRLERNIHDGAQQQLVALAVKLRLMGSMVGKDEAKERVLADQLVGDTQDALENLRDLARGIYPPLLQDAGLVAALQAQARKSPVPTTVEADGIARYPQEQEAAVYFCTLEALQNTAKYADATSVTVRLAESDGQLTFDVTDDGSGFDPTVNGHGSGLQGMADRLEALGGRLDVRSGVGHGTTIIGVLPVSAEA